MKRLSKKCDYEDASKEVRLQRTSPCHADARYVHRARSVKKAGMKTIYPTEHSPRRKMLVREVYDDDDIRIVQGDSRRALADIPDNTFQCCITSPPYWGLRDYGINGQIGAENDPDAYIADLVGIFREVRRTLREDGTLWLNIGDSYTSGDRRWRAPDKKNPARAMSYRPPTPKGLKPKDLIGVPWRLALALQADGWFLRSDIIWNKPNCQPESVKDRPTRAHEYVFLMSKSESYFYDFEAILEPSTNGNGPKNRRTVWNINTNGFHGAHFAVFPPELVRVCLLAGSKPGARVLDPFFGSGTVGLVCREYQRQCVGIELNPEYVKIALDRIGKAVPASASLFGRKLPLSMDRAEVLAQVFDLKFPFRSSVEIELELEIPGCVFDVAVTRLAFPVWSCGGFRVRHRSASCRRAFGISTSS